MKYKVAIFDMDGTILDTLDDLADSLNYTLEAHGYPKRTLEEVRSFVGNGIRKLVERGAGEGISEEELDRLCETQKQYYSVHCADKTRPYEGICQLIQNLRKAGVLTAVVSNKADYAVQHLCKHYFDGLFDAAVGEKSTVRRKPEPDSVYEVLRQLQVTKEEAVYIGDSEVDVETACNASMDGIAVTWGFRTEEFLRSKGATVVVSTMEELEQTLQG